MTQFVRGLFRAFLLILLLPAIGCDSLESAPKDLGSELESGAEMPDDPMAPADPALPEEPADPTSPEEPADPTMPEEPMEPEMPSPPNPAACDLQQVKVAATADDGNVPTNMLDGNLSTRWSAEGIGQSATFDLRRIVDLKNLKIAFYVGEKRNWVFRIEVSKDGSMFNEIYQGISGGQTTELETFPVQAKGIRYVRYVGYGNQQSSEWNSVTEVQFDAQNCGPLLNEGPIPMPTEPPQTPPTSPDRKEFSLLGRPDFNPSRLPSDARMWYERMWSAIKSKQYDELAASDNLYQYGRYLHTHFQTLTLAFRATGDLKLLDEILRLSLLMKAQLRDSWRNTLDGTKQTDGYLNWVWRGYKDGDGVEHYGKDINMLDEVKTHTKLIVIIYMLDLNRGLASPAGYNYGKAADDWKDYFFNHFMKKWRERRRVKDSSYRVFTKSGTHTMYSLTKLNYFLYKLTDDKGYLNEADYWAGHLWNDVREVNAPSGKAFVWPRSSPSHNPGSAGGEYLHPATYARYAVADMVEFYFEGYHNWRSADNLTKFARTISEFLLRQTDSQRYTADIGGNQSRGGYDAASGFSNMTFHTYQISPYASIMPWDKTDKMITESLKVYGVREKDAAAPKEIYIPVGFLLDSLMN